MIRPPRLLPAGAAFLLAACAAPSLRVETPEPIKVDIQMRVDVYQHAPTEKVVSPAPRALEKNNASTPESRRQNRMADIQEFKNSRLVGEGRDGLLVVIAPPPGEYGRFVSKTVGAENADRRQEMKAAAEKDRRPIREIQDALAEEWRARSFTGEYIEAPDADGTGFHWEQKKGRQ